jgi:hypothetical protein
VQPLSLDAFGEPLLNAFTASVCNLNPPAAAASPSSPRFEDALIALKSSAPRGRQVAMASCASRAIVSQSALAKVPARRFKPACSTRPTKIQPAWPATSLRRFSPPLFLDRRRQPDGGGYSCACAASADQRVVDMGSCPDHQRQHQSTPMIAEKAAA